MSYHSIHLKFPATAPFDRDNWFETFVGDFVKPLLATGLVKQYWFTRYGNNQEHEIRLRLTTDDFAALGPIIQQQIQAAGFTDVGDEQNVTVIGTFLNGRVLSPDAPNPSPDDRGQLLLNLNHAIAELFVATLIGPDAEGRFRQEKNTDINNPHGSIFETVHHLLCNTTDVVTEVEIFRFGNNMLGVESPLYASQLKAALRAQGAPVAEMGKMRVRF
jgi:hypothetical protein